MSLWEMKEEEKGFDFNKPNTIFFLKKYFHFLLLMLNILPTF